MPRRTRFQLLTALLLAPVAVGCVSDATNAPMDTVPGFPWVTESDVPQTRAQLKNASGLDLSYARWQEQLGNLPEATEGYQRVLTKQPQSVDALLGLARLEQLAGRPKGAEDAYRKVVQSAPGNAHALDALGQFYAAEQRMPEAITVLQEAVKADPNDAVCRHHLGVALARSGKSEEALAEFTKAVGEAEAHYNVGYIYFEQGRKELAEREFLQAVTLRPDLASAQAMLDELRNTRRPVGQTLQAAARPGSQTTHLARPTSQPAVTQSAASMPSNAPRFVAPASATSLQTPAAALPRHDQPTAESQTVWQMPTKRDTTSIYDEQMQNRTLTP